MYAIITYMNIDFQKLENEKQEIERFLARPDAYTDPEFAMKSKRGAELTEILDLKKSLDVKRRRLAEAKTLADTESDPEMVALAMEDVTLYAREIEEAEAVLEEKLIPRDPLDDKSAIVEIRAGAGGDEASLFAG